MISRCVEGVNIDRRMSRLVRIAAAYAAGRAEPAKIRKSNWSRHRGARRRYLVHESCVDPQPTPATATMVCCASPTLLFGHERKESRELQLLNAHAPLPGRGPTRRRYENAVIMHPFNDQIWTLLVLALTAVICARTLPGTAK
jgi:hypothetical protein